MPDDAIAGQIEGLPAAEVLPIAEQALGGAAIDAVAGSLAWRAERMSVLSIGNGTIGFWRVTGEAMVDGKRQAWSSVVKALDPGAVPAYSVSESYLNARKEIAAIESPELRGITIGLRPIPAYSLMRRPDETYWLWMKDLSDRVFPPWDSQHFIQAARHVGQFNALWPEEDRPAVPWIGIDKLAVRAGSMIAGQAPHYDVLRNNPDHQHVRAAASQVGMQRMLSLLDDVRRLVPALARLPSSVAHNDCHARNLFPTTESGEPVTYGIDWASVNLAPVGIDGGSLAGGSIWWGREEAETVAENEQAIFEAYVDGLRDGGWRGEVSDVRLAYLVQVSGYVLTIPFVVSTIVSGHERKAFLLARWGAADEEATVNEVAERLPVFVPLVDEALMLAERY